MFPRSGVGAEAGPVSPVGEAHLAAGLSRRANATDRLARDAARTRTTESADADRRVARTTESAAADRRRAQAPIAANADGRVALTPGAYGRRPARAPTRTRCAAIARKRAQPDGAAARHDDCEHGDYQ